MPRLGPSLLRRAYRISPDLASLLPACRDLDSAKRELRWIREHVVARSSAARVQDHGDTGSPDAAVHPGSNSIRPAAGLVDKRAADLRADALVRRLCRRRGTGEPLQYVLGNQPFGPLEMLCRKGVLIPRPETEAYTSHLADLISSGAILPNPSTANDQTDDSTLRVLDLCTGTGCISLLLYTLLASSAPRFPSTTAAGTAAARWWDSVRVHGVDVSPAAVSLARANLAHNARRGHVPLPLTPGKRAGGAGVAFSVGDVFSPSWTDATLPSRPRYDVFVANPPYVSAASLRLPRDRLRAPAAPHTTMTTTTTTTTTFASRSVRAFEPHLALTPLASATAPTSGVADEDVFYPALLEFAAAVGARAALLEVGDEAQARRVVQMVLVREEKEKGQSAEGGVLTVEVWRDLPQDPAREEASIRGRRVEFRGSGEARSVFVYRA